MTASGHLLPVAVRRSRQLDTQKLPVLEQIVTPAEVPQKLPNTDWLEGANRVHGRVAPTQSLKSSLCRVCGHRCSSLPSRRYVCFNQQRTNAGDH